MLRWLKDFISLSVTSLMTIFQVKKRNHTLAGPDILCLSTGKDINLPLYWLSD